jgi:hypothetical protein
MVTYSKEGKVVQDWVKAEIPVDCLGNSGQVAVIQVDHPAAMLADQVVMRLAGYHLIFGAAAAQIGLADHAQVTQPLQCAIHGGEIHVPAVVHHLLVDLFSAGMTIQLAEGLQNDRPLLGQAPPALPHSFHEGLEIDHRWSFLQIFAA